MVLLFVLGWGQIAERGVEARAVVRLFQIRGEGRAQVGHVAAPLQVD
jgi:hypothetical protein